VLSDHEHQALRDIERRLRWESPELVRLFTGADSPPAHSRGQRAWARVLVAAALLAGLMIRGHRMLSEAEASAQSSPSLARIPPSDVGGARRVGPTSGPGAPVTDAFVVVGEPITVTTAPHHGRHAGSLSTDRVPGKSIARPSEFPQPTARARNASTDDRCPGGTGEQQ
jgi:Protein of unknown function (DUF3040)